MPILNSINRYYGLISRLSIFLLFLSITMQGGVVSDFVIVPILIVATIFSLINIAVSLGDIRKFNLLMAASILTAGAGGKIFETLSGNSLGKTGYISLFIIVLSLIAFTYRLISERRRF